MLIIGNIPDLFDHMPYVYGVDNKIVFDKRKYEDLTHIDVSSDEVRNGYSVLNHYDQKYGFNCDYFIDGAIYDSWKYHHRKKNPNPSVKYKLFNFFYCGYVYLLAEKLVLDDGNYQSCDEYYFVHSAIDSMEPYKIKAKDKVLAFSKEHNIPYFFYSIAGESSSFYGVHSDVNIKVWNGYTPLRCIKMDDIPRFNDINLIYNDVYNYMLSLKNDDDCIEVSNSDKIKQAGFDLKTSFRKM